jgi:hypothetical protein
MAAGYRCALELGALFQAKVGLFLLFNTPTLRPRCARESSWKAKDFLGDAPLARRGLLAAEAVIFFIVGYTANKTRALIYPSHVPVDSRTEVFRPSKFGLTDFEDLMIPTPDHETLSAFYIRAPNTPRKKPITVLMFHGNAGNIGHRIPIARMFVENIGVSVFMLEYRGYGLSTGSPDEAGLMIDAQTAYEYIRRRAETRDNDIVVFGQSLGGAVAVQLVARNQGDEKLIGLVLENTFTSMRKLIPS